MTPAHLKVEFVCVVKVAIVPFPDDARETSPVCGVVDDKERKWFDNVLHRK